MKKYIHAVYLLLILTFQLSASENDAEQCLMQKEIKHVVILMLENRSFDNVLAWLYDETRKPSHFVPETSDPTFIGLSEDTPFQYTNTLKNSNGEVVFLCSPIKGVPSVSNTPFLNSPKFDPNEEFPNVQKQIFGPTGGNEATMQGFLQDYASLWHEDDWLNQQQQICAIMETHTDKELPIMYGLARHYAVSDAWFSSVPTQTNPNRAFAFCGTSEGEIINGFLGKNNFQSDTLWNRLTEESPETTWSIFWQSDMTPILFPGPFSGTNTFAALKRIPNLNDHFSIFDQFHEQARKGELPDISFLEPQWTISVNLSPKEKEALAVMHKTEEFIFGFQGNDLHPPGDIRTGENLLANIYTSLIANKDAWEHTLLIITFDEHGGLFDHVPPPAAVAPDDKFQKGFKFDRYGVRVPTIFISPLIDKGTIIRSDDASIPFDHTSLISTILKWKNIPKDKWNLGHRVDIAPTFEKVITLENPRQDYVISDSVEDENTIDTIKFGEQFCLRNTEGNYLGVCKPEFLHLSTLGTDKDKVCLEFTSGIGELTNGSFSVIKLDDACLKNFNTLESDENYFACTFSTNHHCPSQWWTIKKAEAVGLGSGICYGDKVYIENHIYHELYQLVPGRLCETDFLGGKHLTTKPITEKDSANQYWIIERP